MTHLSFFDGKSYNVHFHKNNVTWPFSANGLCEVTWHTKKKTVSHQEPIIWSKQLPNFAVVDPGEGWGGSHLDSERRGAQAPKKFGLKIGGPPRSLPWIRPCFVPKSFLKYTGWWKCHDKSTLKLLSLGYCHLMVCYAHQNLFYVNW